MDKNASRAPDNKTPPAGNDLDAKLVPINEFRERAESWMKEVTAQVARLAGRSEDEDRRRKALDKRLADIEERMQSLLTLTEMVSLSKNPFAQPSRSPPAEENTLSIPRADPAAQAAVPTSSDPEAAPPTEPEASPAPALRSHPNDASIDAPVLALPMAAPEWDAPTTPSAPRQEPPLSPGSPPAPSRPARGGADTPRERFLILEWGRLLAPVAHRIDLGAFLGFYVEAGWVRPEIAANVRNLSLHLCHEVSDKERSYRLEELHARSIVLISQLDGQEETLEAASEELTEAREVAIGGWAAATR